MGRSVAFLSNTIKNLIIDGCGDGCIPLPNVAAKPLTKAIEFCKNQVSSSSSAAAAAAAADAADKDDSAVRKKKWAEEFFKMDRLELFDVILAANYLDIKELMDDSCQWVADTIKNMTVEQVREYFNTYAISLQKRRPKSAKRIF
ncbi:hypothetical protein ACLOJK_002834 [Asimina triloba]